jgi:hypothetical protein
MDRELRSLIRHMSGANPLWGVLVQNLNPDILMMQPAKDWNRREAADLLRPAEIWCVLIQREMRPDFVVIGGIILQHVAQVRFDEYHKVVQ